MTKATLNHEDKPVGVREIREGQYYISLLKIERSKTKGNRQYPKENKHIHKHNYQPQKDGDLRDLEIFFPFFFFFFGKEKIVPAI